MGTTTHFSLSCDKLCGMLKQSIQVNHSGLVSPNKTAGDRKSYPSFVNPTPIDESVEFIMKSPPKNFSAA